VEKLVNQKAKVHSVPRHPADVLATWANISKAKKLLKWKPYTSFEDGLKNLVSWYQQNRAWAKDIVTDS